MKVSSSKELAHLARGRIVEVSHRAQSAHAGSALSCVEILSALFWRRQSIDPSSLVILSKGHAAMALYSVAEGLELMSQENLDNYLSEGTKLWGHPAKSADFDFIHWSTGSLGHGLPVACGMAYSSQVLKNELKNIFCILSDGECNEGSVWEAALFASHHGLKNLKVIIDYNKIQSLDFCDSVLNPEPFLDKWKSFGWIAEEVDGHNLKEIEATLERKTEGPHCLLAHTIKGKGVKSIENTVLSHYRPITPEQLAEWERNEK